MHARGGVAQNIVDTEQLSFLQVVDALHLDRVSLDLILEGVGGRGVGRGGVKGGRRE